MLGRSVERVSKGVDTERFRPDGRDLRRSLRLDRRRVVLTVARLVPIKNVALLIEAIAIVRETVADVHLLVVGDGPEATALRAQAAARGIADAVSFAGSVPYEETPLFYRTADVFALSSTFDNSPNVVLEAMASGLPIVTTEVGSVRAWLGDGAGGTVVASGDPVAFAGALARYLSALEAAREAGACNRAKTSAGLSWRSSALRLLEVYERAIAARRGLDRASA
jgi:glycosyltransferase involved in cell wall biosynthesis